MRFGRCVPPKVPVLSLWTTKSGKPLCILIAADIVQPPEIQSSGPLVAHRRPFPNGGSTIGAMMTR